MLRRLWILTLVALSSAACGSNQNNPFTSLTRPPSADSVLEFVSSSWASEPGQPRELLATSADGSKVEQLTSCAAGDQPCDFLRVAPSPDGTRVIAVRTTPGATPGASALYFMDLTRSVEKLVFPRKHASAVDWSADASFLVYASSGEGLSSIEDLYFCGPDGTNDQVLTTTDASGATVPVAGRSPRIDPYLRTAVFEQTDSTGVSRILLYGAPSITITSGPTGGASLPGTPYVVGADADPAFSPDASRVVFRRLTGTGNGGLGTWDVINIASDGSDPQTIATGALYRGAPDWGKSGIVFVETDAAAGKSQLVVVQPDGSGRRVLREENAAFLMGAPRWIPGN